MSAQDSSSSVWHDKYRQSSSRTDHHKLLDKSCLPTLHCTYYFLWVFSWQSCMYISIIAKLIRWYVCRSRKRRKNKHGYFQCTHFTHKTKYVRQHELTCQCFQHRYFRSIFQWQIIWSALMNPPKLLNTDFYYSQTLATLSSRIAVGINSLMSGLLGEPPPGVVPIYGISAEVISNRLSDFHLVIFHREYTSPSMRRPIPCFSYLVASNFI